MTHTTPDLTATLLALEGRVMNALRDGASQVRQPVMSDAISLVSAHVGLLDGDTLQEVFDQVRVASWQIDEPTLLPAGPDAMIFTYRLLQTGTAMGHPLPADTFCTTFWQHDGVSWKAFIMKRSPSRP